MIFFPYTFLKYPASHLVPISNSNTEDIPQQNTIKRNSNNNNNNNKDDAFFYYYYFTLSAADYLNISFLEIGSLPLWFHYTGSVRPLDATVETCLLSFSHPVTQENQIQKIKPIFVLAAFWKALFLRHHSKCNCVN